MALRRPGCRPRSYRFRRDIVAENEEATREHYVVLYKLCRSYLAGRDDVHQGRVIRLFRRLGPHFYSARFKPRRCHDACLVMQILGLPEPRSLEALSLRLLAYLLPNYL